MIVNGSLLNHQIMEELESRWEFYVNFYTEGPNSSGDCIQDMRASAMAYLVDNVWRQEVVDVIVQATAHALKIAICVFSRNRKEDYLKDTLQLVQFGPDTLGKKIFLELDCGHYQALVKEEVEFDMKHVSLAESQYYFNELGWPVMGDTKSSLMQQMTAEATKLPESPRVSTKQPPQAPQPPPDRWDTPPPTEDTRASEFIKRKDQSNTAGRPFDPNEPVQLVSKSARAYFPFDLYSEVEAEEVEKCPEDINGFKLYKIHFEDGENPNVLASDRRRFKMRTSKGKKLPVGATRKVGWCSGSLICQNEHCDFFKLSTERNTNNWDRASQESKGAKNCFSCGTRAVEIECFGRKAIEIYPNQGYLLIYHINWHGCSLKRARESNDEYLTTLAEKNPGLSAGQISMQDMLGAWKENDIDEVYRRGSILADTRRLRHIQGVQRKKGTPHGKESLEALALHSQLCSQRDHFLLYRYSISPGDTAPSYVFKTSKDALSLAADMDVDSEGNSPMKEEACYFDGQHSRCKGYVTLALYTCIHAMKKIICIARMEAKSESQSSVYLFFHLLNEALKEFTGDTFAFFNPVKIVTDAHSANENGIEEVYGKAYRDAKQIGCQKHFMDNVEKNAGKLPLQYRNKFRKLSLDIMHSSSAAEYESLSNQMAVLASMFPVVAHHVKWWDLRRYHHVDYFRGQQFASTNLAEAGHASFHSPTPLWLVQAAQHDASKMIFQGFQIKQFLSGQIPSDGKGPNQEESVKRSYITQKRIAAGTSTILDRVSEYEGQCSVPKRSRSNKVAVEPEMGTITLDELETELAGQHAPTFTAPLREKHRPSKEENEVRSRKKGSKRSAGAILLEKQEEIEEILRSPKRTYPGNTLPRSPVSQGDITAARHAAVHATNPLFRKYLRGTLINCYPFPLECPIMENRPTLVKLRSSQARKCISCNVLFTEEDRKTPPFDVCFRMECHRPWRRNGKVVDKISPCYLHATLKCLQDFDPKIQVKHVQVPDEMLSMITKTHLLHLQTEGFLETIYNALTVSTLQTIYNSLSVSASFLFCYL